MSEVRDLDWYIRRWKGRGWMMSKLIREKEELEERVSHQAARIRILERELKSRR